VREATCPVIVLPRGVEVGLDALFDEPSPTDTLAGWPGPSTRRGLSRST
jgi:hypothetical protein